MTDKAYIVANEQQEREVLENLEREGMLWRNGDKPTEKSHLIKDPITLFGRDDNPLTYDYEVSESYLANFEIVYDGRKEGNMGKKYKANNESISASISGTYVEAEKRVDGDQLLLNAIESERDERVEATREIYDKLRKHEVALNFAIGLAVGLLISMILIAWQTLN